MSLDLQGIRDADGRKVKEIDVPELGGSLRIRMMSGTDMFRMTEHAQKHPHDFDGQSRKLFISCVVDDEGKPLFDGRTVGALMDQPSSVVLKLSEQIQEFCGVGQDEKETVKNSEPTPA